MLSRIRTHFESIDTQLKAIEREKLLLRQKAGKIIPRFFFHDAVLNCSSQMTSFMTIFEAFAKYHYLLKEEDRSSYYAHAAHLPDEHIALVQDWLIKQTIVMQNKKAPLRHDPFGSAPVDFSKLIERYEKLHADLGKRRNVVWCAPVEEMVENYEQVFKDPGLKGLGIFSTYLGQGRAIFDFWRTLNTMADWRAYTTELGTGRPNGPDRKKKPLPVNVWQPALGGQTI